MNTFKRISKTLLAAACALGLCAIANPAEAGRGGSYLKIRSAIDHGNADAIVAQLERAEYIPCNAECLYGVRDLLGDSRYEVREAAAWWFARRAAQKDILLVESLATLASTTDSVEARNAADVLGTFRMPQAVPVLSGIVSRTDLSAEARVHIVRALGTIGVDSANPALALAMTDADSAVRLEATRAWGEIRFQRDAAPVVGLISDPDLAVRRAAAAIVGKFDEATATGALEAALSDPDPAVRRNAAWSLGEIGDASSRDALIAAMDDSSSLVRLTATTAIRKLR